MEALLLIKFDKLLLILVATTTVIAFNDIVASLFKFSWSEIIIPNKQREAESAL